MDRLTVTVSENVIARMRALPAKIQSKVLRPALRAAAKPIAAEAKSNIDKDNSPNWPDTGRLKRSIRVRAAKRRKGVVGVRVVTGKDFFAGETFYGAFREFGHKIGKRTGNVDLGVRKRRRRSAAESAAAGARDAARGVVRPYKFIEPAYESHGPVAAAIAEREIVKGIEREART